MIYTAMTVADWMYRGSNFTIPVQCLDEDGDIAILDEDDTAFLRLYHDSTNTSTLLEVEASLIYKDIGLVVFTLEPADTEELVAKTYEFSVHILSSEGRVDPVLTSKLGILPFNTPVVEED